MYLLDRVVSSFILSFLRSKFPFLFGFHSLSAGSWFFVYTCIYIRPTLYHRLPILEKQNRLTHPDLARVIHISPIQDSVPVSTLRDIVSGTPILNSEGGDWNSQNWVGDALGRLVAAGYLDGKDRDRGLDEMVDVALEAGDEIEK